MGATCDLPREQPRDEEIRAILQAGRVVAVVGLSDRPDRPSHRVAAYLQDAGYRIAPVNPRIDRVLGEKAYARLEDIPGEVDIVDVFRKADAVPGIVEAAIRIGAKVIWMQEGIVHEAAAGRARAAGMKVVMNRCMLKEHGRIGPEGPGGGGA